MNKIVYKIQYSGAMKSPVKKLLSEEALKPIVLVMEYYKPANNERHGEILDTLQRNYHLQCFDMIQILYETTTDMKALRSFLAKIAQEKIKTKIVFFEMPRRATFKSVFEHCNAHNPDSYVVIANNDIYFDESILNLHRFIGKINFANKTCFAITRYEINETTGVPELAFNGNRSLQSSSQDVWILATPIDVPPESGFHFGTPGCDNRIAYLLNQLKYTLYNPVHDIKTYHNHSSQFRILTIRDKLPGLYRSVKPTKISILPRS
jgi:hypothetical protein